MHTIASFWNSLAAALHPLSTSTLLVTTCSLLRAEFSTRIDRSHG